MNTKDIIKAARERLGMTHQQFGDAVGVSRGSVQQWEKGTTAPKRSHQKRVADFIGVSVAKLNGQSTEDQDAIRSTVSLSSTVHEVPVLDKGTAGMYKDYLSGKLTAKTQKYVGPNGNSVFMFRVSDDLMQPQVPKGALAVINPTITPRHGMKVLVTDGETAILRKLVIDGSTSYIEAVNLPAKALTGQILGVAQAFYLPEFDPETGEEIG
jgi:SOS-response transcriptional repressor LexA